MSDEQHQRAPLARREFLYGGIVLLGTGAFAAACSSPTKQSTSDPSTSSSGTVSKSTSAASNIDSSTAAPLSCELTPEQTEGPFYIDRDLVRHDITEERPGSPLDLAITVADVDECRPLTNIAVDIWHCDAMGVYSEQDRAFLRGTQTTDAQGRCSFRTIVPGWYPGRAVHIHVKVHPTPTTQATTQLYFADDLLNQVYSAEPYTSHAGAFVPHARDSIKTAAGGPAPLNLTRQGSGYKTDLVVGLKL